MDSTHISTVLDTTVQLATGVNKSKPTANCTTEEVDVLLKDHKDLISKDFLSWYARCFYKLSPDTVRKLASQARNDGKNPPKLFSHLLKKVAN